MHVRRGGICTTEEQLSAIVDAYTDLDEFVFDVETRGEYRGLPDKAEVAWIGLAGPGRSDIIPMGHINGGTLKPARIERIMHRNDDGTAKLYDGKRKFETIEHAAIFAPAPQQLWPSVVFEALRPLFFSERRKIGHNIRFDLTAIAKYYGHEVAPPPYGDTIVLLHLLNEKLGVGGSFGLDKLVGKIYGDTYDAVGGKIGKIGIDKFNFETVARYLRLDVRYTWRLWNDFHDKLPELKLGGVFRLEMDVLRALVFMEREGALVDEKAMRALEVRIAERQRELTGELHRCAGKVWNINAAAEKGWFVYKVRKHKVRVKTEKKQQPSTRAEDLAAYADEDPMVAKLVEYADLAKLRSTYLEGMLTKLVEGKLHPGFLQAGTETGRFSCVAPNLQNLPRHQDDNPEFSVRSFFIAPPGYRLIVADYSQIEYRLFAHFSGDPFMIRMFKEGIDAHTGMAALITGKDPTDLTPEERTVYGKVVNFSVGFGSGAPNLAAKAGISLDRAKGILEQHRRSSPDFYRWKAALIAKARRQRPPHVRTMLGRIRRLPELCAAENKVRWKAERQCVNTRVQGSAADIIKLAMVGVHREFEGTPVQMILTVHDELVTIAPKSQAGRAADKIQEIMENAYELRVPLTASVTVCDRWSDGK